LRFALHLHPLVIRASTSRLSNALGAEKGARSLAPFTALIFVNLVPGQPCRAQPTGPHQFLDLPHHIGGQQDRQKIFRPQPVTSLDRD